MVEDELPTHKQPQPFPRDLDGISVAHLRAYRAELEEEIAKIDAAIRARGDRRAQAEKLFT